MLSTQSPTLSLSGRTFVVVVTCPDASRSGSSSVTSAITIPTPNNSTQRPEITIPAIARPRPFWLRCLICFSAITPRMTLNRIMLRMPRISDAIASPLVPCGGPCWYGLPCIGGCPYGAPYCGCPYGACCPYGGCSPALRGGFGAGGGGGAPP